MTQLEYEHLRSWLDEDYAQDVAKAMAMSLDEGREAAQKQLGELLPAELSSEGHHYWKIVAEDGAAVGDLWIQIGPAKVRDTHRPESLRRQRYRDSPLPVAWLSNPGHGHAQADMSGEDRLARGT
jgi:hypothetical protein